MLLSCQDVNELVRKCSSFLLVMSDVFGTAPPHSHSDLLLPVMLG